MNTAICFIGAGHIANAMIAGLLANGYPAKQIWVTGRDAEKLQRLSNQWGIHTTTNNQEAARQTNTWILCVRPFDIAGICKELQPLLTKNPLIISVAAGVGTHLLHRWLESSTTAIVRAMPNNAAAVRASATGLFAKQDVNLEQKKEAELIFRCIGLTVWTENEDQLDVLTASIGAGSAYIFLVMDAIKEAMQSLETPAETAQLLVKELTLGAARLAIESDKSFTQLLEAVVTPKGVTDAAIQVFEKKDIRSIFKQAIEAGWQRTKTLAKALEEHN